MKTFFLLTVMLSGLAFAQAGLYAPAPPADSAFVRIVGASSASINTKNVVAKKGAASTYVVIPQGIVTIKVANTSQKFDVKAGGFYSVVNMSGKLTLLNDQTASNRAKALLTVYNLSKGSIDLKTADGKTSVVAGVSPGHSGSRTVNGITVDLAAFAGSKALAIIKGVKLERGSAYALVASDSGLTLTQSTTE